MQGVGAAGRRCIGHGAGYAALTVRLSALHVSVVNAEIEPSTTHGGVQD